MLRFLKIFLIPLSFFCSPVYACGPGTVFTVFPVLLIMGVGLIPLVFLKTFVYQKSAPALTFKEIFFPYLGSSVLTTAIIIPTMMIVWFIVAMYLNVFFEDGLPSKVVIVRSFWEYIAQFTVFSLALSADLAAWSFAVACMVLLGVFFLVSSWSEGKMLAKFLKKKQNSLQVKKNSWRANAAAYACLYVVALCILGWILFFYDGKTLDVLYHTTILSKITIGGF